MVEHTELLFAHWAVPALINLRGSRWRELVTEVGPLPEAHPDALAFALMMVDLNGCIRCDAQRYRERGGCAKCARSTLLAPSQVGDAILINRFHAAQKRVAETPLTGSF